MKMRLVLSVAALAVLIPIGLRTVRRPSVAHAEPQAVLSMAEAQKIATDAYVFGYPLVTVHLTEVVETNVDHAVGTKAPVNQLANLKQYPTSSFRSVTAPNADTLYTSAFLDLSKEPLVFSYPDMGDRYFLFPFLDAYTNVVDVPGQRTTGGKGATYFITGPGWQGDIPALMTQIKIPTKTAWLIGRTYCTGTPEDYKAVHALQAKYKLYPASAGGRPYQPQPGKVDPSIDMKTGVREQVNALKGSDYFTLLAKLMKDNPPAAGDAPLLARMAKIGIVPGQPFDGTKAPEAAIDAAPKAGQEAIKGRLAEAEKKMVNGWMVMTDTGIYGTNYLWRAFVTAVGLGANLSQDAVYPFSETDKAGQKYSGKNRYVMHFDKGELPPAKGFWSLTMYNKELFFVKNPLNRYTVSPRDHLTTNHDGSTDLYIQNDKPKGHESNWLPAPAGEFALMLRLYWPNVDPPSVLDGSWKPPAVEVVSGGNAER